MSSYWDDRYRDRPAPTEPAAFVVDELAPLLGEPGRALDLAGGAGRHSVWLAERGWVTTLVETSGVALDLAAERADQLEVGIALVHADLTVAPLPAGPWDLVLITHYLQRDLFPRIVEELADGGLLAYSIATVRNLERFERPPLPYILEEGEAPSLAEGLDIIHYEEGWSVEGRHEARVVARKPEAG
ncbi:MAG: methyltransferase domain-containing protein [Actinomycetota bacterium]